MSLETSNQLSVIRQNPIGRTARVRRSALQAWCASADFLFSREQVAERKSVFWFANDEGEEA
jgi:hypothetical protein